MERKLSELLPAEVFQRIQEDFRSVDPLEREDFDNLSGDEDSLTGALASSMRKALRGHHMGIRWKTDVKKLRGRGHNAPEKAIGADLIIEFEITSQQNDIIALKSVLAQAKKQWKGTDSILADQTAKMESIAEHGSIVLDYDKTGCLAVRGDLVVQAKGNRAKLPVNETHRLGDLLANSFLACKVGRMGMHYDALRQRLHVQGSAPRLHVGTRVRTTVTLPAGRRK